MKMNEPWRTRDISPSGIELVCFDLGGVLVRVRESWEATLGLASVANAEGVVQRAGRAAIDELMLQYETGRLDTDTFFERAAELMDIDEDAARRAMDSWLVGPYPGLDELLDLLEAAGIATACLSNTNAYHWEMMTSESHAALPLARLDYRLASQDLGWMKPDPRMYAEVERVSGAAPEAIAYFDDRQINIDGALARGWRATRIDPAGDTVAEMAEALRKLKSNVSPPR